MFTRENSRVISLVFIIKPCPTQPVHKPMPSPNGVRMNQKLHAVVPQRKERN